jgi:hypothetical protein
MFPFLSTVMDGLLVVSSTQCRLASTMFPHGEEDLAGEYRQCYATFHMGCGRTFMPGPAHVSAAPGTCYMLTTSMCCAADALP